MEYVLMNLVPNKIDTVTKLLQFQDTISYEAKPWHSDDHMLTRQMTTNSVCQLIYDVSY